MTVQSIQRSNSQLQQVSEPSWLDDCGDYAARITDYTKTFFSTSFDPLKHTLYFLFPSFGAYWQDGTRAYETNPIQEANMPLPSKQVAIREINRLAECAGFERKVILYTKPESTFFSFGGYCSLSSPLLFAPQEHIFRIGFSSFGNERANENLSEKLWSFSDHEVRFFTAREIGRMKFNFELLGVVLKVALISSFTFLWFTPVGIMTRIALSALSLGTYLFLTQQMEYTLDSFSVKTLARALNTDETSTKRIAIQALEKVSQQNINRRTHYWADYFFVTKNGNDLRNYNEPLLTNRIKHLNN